MAHVLLREMECGRRIIGIAMNAGRFLTLTQAFGILLHECVHAILWIKRIDEEDCHGERFQKTVTDFIEKLKGMVLPVPFEKIRLKYSDVF